MLWFLSLAAGSGWRVDDYSDDALGVMGRNAAGRTAMVRVTLRPRVAFSGERLASRADILQLHQRAHDECFIANSVTTEVRCEPLFDA
jgi:organic hydroperoxide reductase OsmC/OhrA